MSGKLIVVDSDERVTLSDYTGYESIRDIVHGFIEHCGTIASPIPFLKDNLDMFCNEEFLIRDDEEFNKVNAVASLLCNQEIRGNVVFLIADSKNPGENRGFEYIEDEEGEEDLCECWYIEDLLLRFISNNRDLIDELHAEFDNNKSIPSFEVTEIERD